MIAVVSMFYSCSKKKNDSNTIPTSLTATINGTAFNGTTCIDSFFASTSGILSIGGGSGYDKDTGFAYPYIVMDITDYSGGMGAFYFYNGSGGGGGIVTGSYTSGAKSALYGTITITARTPYLTGTFNFTCLDSTKVAGSFQGKQI